MQENIPAIQELFKDIERIYPKYAPDKKQSTFNIFSVLSMERDEVYCHSQLIFELLNPKGSHKKGDTFLKLFMQVVGFSETLSANVSVLKERQNIDLQIRDSHWAIAVENKIGHYDTHGQIEGYYEKVKANYKNQNVYVLYLSLYGREPDPISSGSLSTSDSFEPDKVFCISYGTHIKEWIELCIKEVALEPTMRETFSQYVTIIKKLTGQTMSQAYLNEIKTMLSKKSTFRHIPIIQEAAHQIKKDTQLAFWKELRDELLERGIVKSREDFVLNCDNDKALAHLVTQYYDKSRNKPQYYGLEWKLMPIDTLSSIGFKVEIAENELYLGFRYIENGRPNQKCNEANLKPYKDNATRRIEGELNTVKYTSTNGWWFAYYHIKSLWFRTFNSEVVLNLIEADSRKQFISSVVSDIKTLIDAFEVNLAK